MRNRSAAVSAWLAWASRHGEFTVKNIPARFGNNSAIYFSDLFPFLSRGYGESDGGSRPSGPPGLGVLTQSLMLWHRRRYPCRGAGHLWRRGAGHLWRWGAGHGRTPCLWFAGLREVDKRPQGWSLPPFFFLPLEVNSPLFALSIGSWVRFYMNTYSEPQKTPENRRLTVFLSPVGLRLEDQTTSDRIKLSIHGACLESRGSHWPLQKEALGQEWLETKLNTHRVLRETQGLSHRKVLRNFTVCVWRKVGLNSTSFS